MTAPKRTYALGPRLRGVVASLRPVLRLGRIYRTRNPGSGCPAVAEVPTGATPERVPPGALQAMVTAYVDPPMLVIEQRAGRPTLLAAVLDLAAELLAALKDDPEAMAHLSSAAVVYRRPVPTVPKSVPPRRWQAPRWLGAVAVAAGVLVGAFGDLRWPRSAAPALDGVGGSPIAYTYPEAGSEGQYLADMVEFPAPLLRMGEKPMRYMMPPGPMPGQARPPCWDDAGVVAKGACWYKLDLRPPCPTTTVEYNGGCYKGMPERKGGPPPVPKDAVIRRTP